MELSTFFSILIKRTKNLLPFSPNLLFLAGLYWYLFESGRNLLPLKFDGSIVSLANSLNVQSLRIPRPHDNKITNVPGRTDSTMTDLYSKSLVRLYNQFDKGCAARPFQPYLNRAVDKIMTDSESLQLDKEGLGRNDTLFIYADSIDNMDQMKISIELILNTENIERVVILFSGYDAKRVILHGKFRESTKRLRKRPLQYTFLNSRNVFEELSFVRKANITLVHGGIGAALAALVSYGTVYFTDSLAPFAENNHFRWMVSDLRPTNESIWPGYKSHLHAFSAIGRVSPTCCDFDAFGDGEDQKIICKNGGSFSKEWSRTKPVSIEEDEIRYTPPCWILSLGCGGKWSFEESIIKRTNCVVQTFDCTGTYLVPEQLKGRVTFHELCVTVSGDEREFYKSLSELIEIGAVRSGLPPSTAPTIIKMDIEGYEHPVLHDLLETGNESELPEQLLLEIHAFFSTGLKKQFSRQPEIYAIHDKPNMQALFDKLWARDYVLVHRADNRFCTTCTEVNLMRRGVLPGES